MRASYVCHLTNDSAEDERCQIKTGLVRKEGLSICAGAFFLLMEASKILKTDCYIDIIGSLSLYRCIVRIEGILFIG